MAHTTHPEDHARDQAAAQVESIVEMVAALECDYDRLAELRDKSKNGHYVAGWNMPGYMPDNEPAVFDDDDSARAYIAESMRNHAEQASDDAASQEEAHFLEGAAADCEQGSGDYGHTVAGYHYWVTRESGLSDPDEAEELAELESAAGDCEDEDDARQRINEDPLSIEVRSDWHAPGESAEDAEFCILLCTGGPAVRIIGDLDRGVPSRPRVQYQDWGTPWTEYFPSSDERAAIETYCAQFFYGE